ncbi:MAG: hypothetical protein WAW41_04100 [Methylobacter sp.]
MKIPLESQFHLKAKVIIINLISDYVIKQLSLIALLLINRTVLKTKRIFKMMRELIIFLNHSRDTYKEYQSLSEHIEKILSLINSLDELVHDDHVSNSQLLNEFDKIQIQIKTLNSHYFINQTQALGAS